MTSPAAAGPPRQAPLSALRQEVGLASWYGQELQGSATTSGEPFDMNALTAAHRKLPLGTRITVTNLTNHRSVVLRVNDRGPNVAGRLLDVSKAAAERLGFRGAGIAKVRVIPLSYPRWYLARRNDSGASRPVLCAENR
ncbi:MAG TPA: septal ring lytic transglycosylase RlpA family protein [Candidatus Binatia bacterium]|nr:septal ring lytic transglycosylase RlpA family protein [Candidatus Binatia bacterium]